MYRYSILEEEAQSVMFDHHSVRPNSSGDYGGFRLEVNGSKRRWTVEGVCAVIIVGATAIEWYRTKATRNEGNALECQVRESWCAKRKDLVNGSEDNDGAGVGKSDCTLLREASRLPTTGNRQTNRSRCIDWKDITPLSKARSKFT